MAAMSTHPLSVGRAERLYIKCSSSSAAYSQPSRTNYRRAVAARHRRRRDDAAAPSVSAPAHRAARPAHDVSCHVSTSSSSPSSSSPSTASVTLVIKIHATLVGLALHSRRCQIGYVDHTGCHQLVPATTRPTSVVTALPRGCQSMFTWTIQVSSMVVF
jgi:hypothetical protein